MTENEHLERLYRTFIWAATIILCVIIATIGRCLSR